MPIYKCPKCGLGAVRPAEFNAAAYYDESYFNGGKPDGYSDYLGAGEVLRNQFCQELSLLKKLGLSGGDLLELGCAYGYFLEVAQHDFRVSGLEICQAAVASCNQRGLKGVRHGEISTDSLANMSMADVVVLLDVIEHLPDPAGALEAAVTKIRPGGILLITTGDFSSICARAMGRHWRLMTPPQHLWYFTPRSLIQIAKGLDLELVHLDHPFKTVPVGLIIYQVCRYFSLRPSLPSWMHRVGVPVNLFDAMRMVFRKNVS